VVQRKQAAGRPKAPGASIVLHQLAGDSYFFYEGDVPEATAMVDRSTGELPFCSIVVYPVIQRRYDPPHYSNHYSTAKKTDHASKPLKKQKKNWKKPEYKVAAIRIWPKRFKGRR